MKNFWDNRYCEECYAYGEEPNEFFKVQIALLPQGKILLPAEGEGRNAVYAPKKCWPVYAYDQSIEELKKTNQLAIKNNVFINYFFL